MTNYTVALENDEIRGKSRSLLVGNWGIGALLVLVLSMISGVGGSLNLSINNWGNGYFYGILASLITLSSIFAMAYSILVINVMNYGFINSYLKMGREGKINFENLFAGFRDYGRVVGMMLLKNLLIFLWTLLLIIPGIIKQYAYSMSEFILLDNPKMDSLTAITKSKEMMQGWKAKLFLLDLSLIGWWFLSLFTCGIGYLFLASYYKTNHAVFYMEMTGTIDENETENDDYIIEAAQKEIEKINKEKSDFS